MDQKIKAKWVKALRSGEYKQGQGTLRAVGWSKKGKVTTFCCLGVLCNLHAQTKPYGIEHETDPSYYFGQDCFPPDNVVSWADLPDQNPMVNWHGVEYNLSELNDTQGLSFDQIADIIEQQL